MSNATTVDKGAEVKAANVDDAATCKELDTRHADALHAADAVADDQDDANALTLSQALAAIAEFAAWPHSWIGDAVKRAIARDADALDTLPAKLDKADATAKKLDALAAKVNAAK